MGEWAGTFCGIRCKMARTDPKKSYDIAIIGGGASGMSAALSVSRGCSVIILEKNSEPGRKILATGNGRCNITNGEYTDFKMIEDFFLTLGLHIRADEEGRYYPFSGQALSVRDTLWEALRRSGAEIRLGETVNEITVITANEITTDLAARRRAKGRRSFFEIKTASGGSFFATNVIITTGGKAGPQYGCTGDGCRFARGFGHSIKSILPALVQVLCDETRDTQRLKILKGVRARCKATFMVGKDAVGEAEGEVQFTESGLSGICIFDLSKHLRSRETGVCKISLDFAPDFSEKYIYDLIGSALPAGLRGLLPSKLADLILSEVGGDGEAASRLTKGMMFHVSGTKGWKEAQTTSGGVLLEEVDMQSMESRLVSGLFFAGELLDFDERCGGFNLSWAWASGIRAGRAAGSKV
jgi:predicted Rossmann fold flavoprotein